MMPNLKSLLLAGAAAMLPFAALPLAAQEAPVAEVVVPPPPGAEVEETGEIDGKTMAADAKSKMQREMDEAIALVEKMFDTSNLPPIDPARLTLAQQTTNALIPSGSLEKMIDNLYGKMFKTIMGEMGGESDLMISIKTGVESEKVAALDEATRGRIADMFDPHRKEREDQITRVVKPLISEALADMEPPMRTGLARAYARKFTAAQLGDLNGFLATPTGTAYANEWMAAQADPEVMLAVLKAVPPLVTKFIDRAPEIEKDFKDLPKEKQLSDFNDKDLAKLAKLMKVDVKVLKEQRDMWNSPVEDAADATEVVDAATDVASAEAAADAAEAAADAAVAVEATEYDRSNWSEADRQRVAELEAAYLEAEAAAVEKARERLGRNPSE